MNTAEKKPLSRTNYYIILAFIFSLYMLINPSLVISCAKEAVVLFSTQLLPALFPFMIVIQLLIRIDDRDAMGKIFRPVARLFGIDSKYSRAVFAGIAAGYPNGAIALKNTYDGSGYIYTALVMCSAASPMYMLGTVGQIILQKNALGIIILACHYAGLVATALLVRRFDKSGNGGGYISEHGHRGGNGLFDTLEDVMLQCGKVLVKILGFIILFRIISQSFVLYILAPLGMPETTIHLLATITKGVFEMAEGCSYAKILPSGTACVVISFILGFGGFSVLFQMMSVLRGLPVKLRGLLPLKLIHGVISASLCAVVMSFYRGDAISTINSTQAVYINKPAGIPGFLYMLLGGVLFLAVRQCPRIWERFCRTMSRFR